MEMMFDINIITMIVVVMHALLYEAHAETRMIIL